MKRSATILSLFLTCLFVASCKKFEYSPYQEKATLDMPGNLNAANLARLMANSENADDTVTIAFTGDCQRFYERLEDLVKTVNNIPNVDFLIMDGDISDFGILQEYLWINDRLKSLNIPYLCAIGNHDFTANNGASYTKIFGDKNYAFTYKGYKFLFHDTNGREYSFNGKIPDIGWLGNQLNDPLPQWFVGVSHVSPFNEDFDRALEEPYKNLFAAQPNFILSLHGHIHGTTDSFYYEDHVRYITSNAVIKTELVLLKLIHGQIIKQMITY